MSLPASLVQKEGVEGKHRVGYWLSRHIIDFEEETQGKNR